jgi:hypothetical protein
MENDILTKEYVLNNGVDFENLWSEYCSDRILDKPEDDIKNLNRERESNKRLGRD